MTGAIARGLSLSDLDNMTVGDVVDYCITYNEIMNPDEEKVKIRQATQKDWDSL